MHNLNKLFFVTVILLLFVSFNGSAQTWNWLKGGIDVYNSHDFISGCYSKAVATDDSGDVYVWARSRFSKEIIGTDTFALFGEEILIKYDNASNFKWAIPIGDFLRAACNGICTDRAGNVYATGSMTVPSYGVNFENYYLNPNVNDSLGFGTNFIVKYNKYGHVVYAKKFGGNGNGGPAGIALNSTGEAFVACSMDSVPTKIGAVTFNEKNLDNFFLAKFDTRGNVIWAKDVTGTSKLNPDLNYVSAIAVDNNDNCYIGGFVTDTLTFNKNTPVYRPNRSFLAKYDNNGNFVWVKGLSSGSGVIYGMSISTDGPGNIYMAGNNGDSVLTCGSYKLHFSNNSAENNFLVKFDSSGSVSWGKKIHGGNVFNVCCDLKNNVYLSGSYEFNGPQSPINILLDSYVLQYPADAGFDPMYIAKFSPYGNMLCASTLSGGGLNVSYITTNALGKVCLASQFLDSLNVPGVCDLFTYTTPVFFKTAQVFFGTYTCDLADNIPPAPASLSALVYPNPATNLIHINKGTESDKTTLVIYNELGMEVKRILLDTGDNSLPVNDLAPGLYVVKIISNGSKPLTQKLMILR